MKINDALTILTVVARGFEVIKSLTGSGSDSTVATGVKSVLAVVADGQSGKLTPDQVYAALEKLEVGIASNDRDADDALDRKFPKG